MISVLILSLLCLAGGKTQPTACKEDAHCTSGFYCERDAHYCRKCLVCAHLKREQPLTGSTCIKSVVECGTCFKGLVEDHRSDVNAECVLPDAQNENITKNPITYIVAIGIVAFFVLLVVAVVYVYRKKDLKILASMHTEVESSLVRNGVPPNTQESPPPYNAHYAHVRPVSPTEHVSAPASAPASALASAPASAPDLTTHFPANSDEEYRPFIKRAPGPCEQAARQSASSQAAHIFNNPAYVRIPPSYDSTVPGSRVADEDPFVTGDTSFVVHDEDTMESTWTPDNDVNSDVNGNTTVHDFGNSSEGTTSDMLPSLLAAARDTHQHTRQHPHQQSHVLSQRSDHGPPAKILCIRQETSNDRNGETAESSHNRENRGPSRHTSGSNDLSVTISVVNNINTAQQFSNITS